MWRRSAAARPLAALLARRTHTPSVRPLAVHGCGARAAASSVCPSRRGLSTNSQPVAEDDGGDLAALQPAPVDDGELSIAVADFASTMTGAPAAATREEMSALALAKKRQAVAGGLAAAATAAAAADTPQRTLFESVADSAANDPTGAVAMSPCHPSSLLSLPLYNMLRSDVHSRAFLKMAMRASVAPKSSPQRRTWLPVPEWDLADHLSVPNNRSHSHWAAFQSAMASNASVQLASAKMAAQGEDGAALDGDDAESEPEPTHNAEPFSSDQIEANLADFLLSPTLHQCQLLIDTVAQAQQDFLAEHREIEKERLSLLAKLQRDGSAISADELHQQIKAWKQHLHAAWEPRNTAVLVVMVDQFVAFMDEPVGDAPTTDPRDVQSILSSFRPPGETDPGVKDQLLKTRSGRLRFDPSLAELANFSAPHEWYPLARSLPRKFIVHVGPTNSGKCWGRGTAMLLWDGSSKRVEDVVAGDVLVGDDSLPRVVRPGSVFRGHTAEDEAAWLADQGPVLEPSRRPGTFEVRLHSESRQRWTCNGDHILVLKFCRPPTEVEVVRRASPSPSLSEEADPVESFCFSALELQGSGVVDVTHTYPTESDATLARATHMRRWAPLLWEGSVYDYLACDPHVRSLARMWSPEGGVTFAPAERPLRERLEQQLGRPVDDGIVERTAWALGVWLARGVVRAGSASVGLTGSDSTDAAVADALEQWVAAVAGDATNAGSGVVPAVAQGTTGELDLGPVMLALLESYKLRPRKHLSPELLRESKEVRRALVAGMLDGQRSSRGKGVEIEVVSGDRECMEGVQLLCRSVGLATGPVRAHQHDSTTAYHMSLGSGGQMRTLAPLLLRGEVLKTESADADSEAQAGGGTPPSHHESFTLTRVAHASYFGFTLQGPNGRCLLADGIVSHNTYHAMQRLMSARSGLYCGPLRLLAWEVKDKMSRRGVACNLLTGQEKDEVPGACHTSSTVEMANIDTIIDVAVVDEVQMLASSDRGSAWTRALLGIPAYEVHVCGDPSMVEMVEELCAITGEPVEVREYQRLTPLVVSPPLMNGVRDVRRGDCIVAFSRLQLYKLKREVEQQLALKCCIIYGSLPPEARRQQAGLFNDPNSGYDVLLASDAIGMGLNLNISRVVFAKMEKYDGKARRPLTPSETLQIAGRAGRFNTNTSASSGAAAAAGIRTLEEASASNRGEVTTMQPDEHAYLQWAMKQPLAPIDRVGLAPTFEQLATLHQLRPKETLSNLLTYFGQYAKLDSLYFTVDMEGMKQIADALEHVEFRSMRERWVFCQAPARMDLPHVANAMRIYAELYVAGGAVPANAIRIPQLRTPTNDVNMNLMETFYQVLDLYVWLGLKFGVAQFVDIEKAQTIRDTVARVVQAGIENLAPTSAWMKRRRHDIEQRQLRERQRKTPASANVNATAEVDSAPPAPPAPVIHTSTYTPPSHQRHHNKQPQQNQAQQAQQHQQKRHQRVPSLHGGASGPRRASRTEIIAREIEQRVARAEADAHHSQFKGARKDRPASGDQLRKSDSKAKGRTGNSNHNNNNKHNQQPRRDQPGSNSNNGSGSGSGAN